MTRLSPSPLNPDLLEAAADWCDRLETLTPPERARLDAWLAADPDHARAFALMRTTLLDTALLDATAEHASIPAAAPTRPAPATRPSAGPNAGLRAGLADRLMRGLGSLLGGGAPLPAYAGLAGAAVIAAALMLALPTLAPEPAGPDGAEAGALRYAAGAGEEPQLQLPDLSQVSLSPRSTLDIRFTDERRLARLDEGAALFEVASEPERPFSVEAGPVTATALGTVFAVDRLDARSVEVRVFEGAVQVEGLGLPARTLGAGEWIILAAGRSEESGLLGETAWADWREDWLLADGLRLPWLLAKLNRHADRPFTTIGADLTEARLSGRFRLDDPEQAGALLEQLLEAEITETRTARVLTRPDPDEGER